MHQSRYSPKYGSNNGYFNGPMTQGASYGMAHPAPGSGFGSSYTQMSGGSSSAQFSGYQGQFYGQYPSGGFFQNNNQSLPYNNYGSGGSYARFPQKGVGNFGAKRMKTGQGQAYRQNRNFDSFHQPSSAFDSSVRSSSYLPQPLMQKPDAGYGAGYPGVGSDFSRNKSGANTTPFSSSNSRGRGRGGMSKASPSDNELRERLLSHLRLHSEVDFQDLLRSSKAQKRDVNRNLYEMSRAGIVKKVQEQPPVWSICQLSSSSSSAACGSLPESRVSWSGSYAPRLQQELSGDSQMKSERLRPATEASSADDQSFFGSSQMTAQMADRSNINKHDMDCNAHFTSSGSFVNLDEKPGVCENLHTFNYETKTADDWEPESSYLSTVNSCDPIPSKSETLGQQQPLDESSRLWMASGRGRGIARVLQVSNTTDTNRVGRVSEPSASATLQSLHADMNSASETEHMDTGYGKEEQTGNIMVENREVTHLLAGSASCSQADLNKTSTIEDRPKDRCHSAPNYSSSASLVRLDSLGFKIPLPVKPLVHSKQEVERLSAHGSEGDLRLSSNLPETESIVKHSLAPTNSVSSAAQASPVFKIPLNPKQLIRSDPIFGPNASSSLDSGKLSDKDEQPCIMMDFNITSDTFGNAECYSSEASNYSRPFNTDNLSQQHTSQFCLQNILDSGCNSLPTKFNQLSVTIDGRRIEQGTAMPVRSVSHSNPFAASLGLVEDHFEPTCRSLDENALNCNTSRSSLYSGSESASVESLTSLSNESFAALNKNSVSALMEYAQSRKLDVQIHCIDCHGPPHKPKYVSLQDIFRLLI